ncbi:MAG: ubiquinol-cytochrome c reductase iron-sulfur subunit [Burkholderiales bacterium]
MSQSTDATLAPGAAGAEAVDPERRRLLVATCIAGGAASGAVAWPFLASMQPSDRARALGAPVEADISALEPGQQMIVEWQGKPVWIVRRTKEMLATLTQDTAQLADPNSKRSEQPTAAQNEYRSLKPEYLVVVGICTHLGCSPTARFAPNDPSMGPNWPGGFLCPCHGSKFDLAGRVFANMPAPDNLPVPNYKYLSDTKLLIGDETKGA